MESSQEIAKRRIATLRAQIQELKPDCEITIYMTDWSPFCPLAVPLDNAYLYFTLDELNLLQKKTGARIVVTPGTNGPVEIHFDDRRRKTGKKGKP